MMLAAVYQAKGTTPKMPKAQLTSKEGQTDRKHCTQNDIARAYNESQHLGALPQGPLFLVDEAFY